MKIRTAHNRSIALAMMANLVAPAAALLTPVPSYAYSSSERYYDREEIEQLTAPIALYPDPLLAHAIRPGFSRWGASCDRPDDICHPKMGACGCLTLTEHVEYSAALSLLASQN